MELEHPQFHDNRANFTYYYKIVRHKLHSSF